MSESKQLSKGRESVGQSNLRLRLFAIIGESTKGRRADALAHGGDEGRDKLR